MAKEMLGCLHREKANAFSGDQWRVPMWHGQREMCHGVNPNAKLAATLDVEPSMASRMMSVQAP